MKHRNVFNFVLLLFLISCGDKPAYEKEDWTIKDYNPEVIEWSLSTVENRPTILPKEELFRNVGRSIEGDPVCSKLVINKNGQHKDFCCLFMDTSWDMVYKIIGDTAVLSNIDFGETNVEISTPQILLSKATQLADIKEVFPNAYAHRNIGVHTFAERGQNGVDWVYLKDDLHRRIEPNQNQLELLFIHRKLKYLEYSWYPNFTDEEWAIYTKEWRRDCDLENLKRPQLEKE